MSNSKLKGEDLQILRTLVARVGRAFYEPRQIAVLDALNKSKPLKDDDLALLVKMSPKEIHKICGKLREERLLRSEQRNEPRKPDQRLIPRVYYFIDYKQFVDVVKWRMFKMQRTVREEMQEAADTKGYICPNDDCKREYTLLEATYNIDPQTGLFLCEVCSSELVKNDNSQKLKECEAKVARLVEQSQLIISLLKKTDSIVIPASYSTAAGIVPGTTKKGATAADKELALAQDTGAAQADIVVVIKEDNEAAKRARQAEAEKKREQNALPIWYQASTIGPASGEVTATATDNSSVVDAEEEKWEETGDSGDMDEEDTEEFYRKYYANLMQGEGTADYSVNDLEEESERDKTSDLEVTIGVKRPREDETEDEYPSQRYANGATEREQSDEEINDEEYEEDTGVDESREIPTVMVSGEPVLITEITEEHKDKMTPEEYMAYYQVWQSWEQ
ncbi:uncharacterized protein VTP21DRAFT_3765 [Calcarisporiella thermophila]|uniref:uncharacterized protein n=1 Tax=Calcarisporiella thermophila TaxID=911321 RepID=UPI0037424C0F